MNWRQLIPAHDMVRYLTTEEKEMGLECPKCGLDGGMSSSQSQSTSSFYWNQDSVRSTLMWSIIRCA